MSSGREYVLNQGIEEHLVRAVATVIKERPVNALLRISKLLAESAPKKKLHPHWNDPTIQKEVKYSAGDVIISVPAKSGTSWTMNIVHQLKKGGDADFRDIYAEVPWVEFWESPYQDLYELQARWDAIPSPRAFKTHTCPGPFMDFRDDLKYVVVVRNPEEAIVSLKPFVDAHTEEVFAMWDFPRMALARPTFQQFFEDIVLKFKPDQSMPDIPGGMLTMFFFNFINSWWSLRNKPNVLMLHFSDMKRDHEGSVRKIASFLGHTPSDAQWMKIMEYTSFNWMKEHEEKFEIKTLLPFPFMYPGGMVRKGLTGAQSGDGMTPEIAATIKDFAQKMVSDPSALSWLYAGGAS